MKFGKLLVAGLALAAFIGIAAPALAATATSNVNVRDEPGGSVVDVMQRGEEAEIIGRSGSWCEVDRGRRREGGWVSCQYLSGAGSGGGVSIGVGGGGSGGRPNVSVDFSIPGFSFSIGDGGFDRPGRPGRPGGGGGGDRVCFFEHVDYEGDSFCARPGERLRSLGAWNDRISSIRVRGDAEALVCEHADFRGRCVTIDRNARDLGRRGNDIISSIRVR